jgi:hypothetical protein
LNRKVEFEEVEREVLKLRGVKEVEEEVERLLTGGFLSRRQYDGVRGTL